MVERLKRVYRQSWFAEDGEAFPLRVFLLKDEVTVGLDATGESLHKRGYRKLSVQAPIAENLAAALIMLTPWKHRLYIRRAKQFALHAPCLCHPEFAIFRDILFPRKVGRSLIENDAV